MEKTSNEYVQPEQEIIKSQGEIDYPVYDEEGELQRVREQKE